MNNCQMIPVQSSSIYEVGYEEDTQLLYIRFHGNKTYSYNGVSAMEFDMLLGAPSVGVYFNRNIRNIYPCTKVE